MSDFVTSLRRTAAASLVASALLSSAAVVLQPSFGTGGAARLAEIHDAGARAAVSAAAFTLSQLPFLLGMLGVGWLVWDGAPRLARVGATLGVLGAFGHTVIGGLVLTEVVMAGQTAQRRTLGAFDATLQGSPVMMFSLVGLAGTVLGLLLLSVALLRTRVVPGWLPPTIWAFLVVEFAGTAVSPSASYLSAVLLLILSGALAVAVRPGSRNAVPSTIPAPAHSRP